MSVYQYTGLCACDYVPNIMPTVKYMGLRVRVHVHACKRYMYMHVRGTRTCDEYINMLHRQALEVWLESEPDAQTGLFACHSPCTRTQPQKQPKEEN